MGQGISTLLDRDPAFFLDPLDEKTHGSLSEELLTQCCKDCEPGGPGHQWEFLHSAAADYREGIELFEKQQDYDLARIKFVQVVNKFYDNFLLHDHGAEKQTQHTPTLLRESIISRSSSATQGEDVDPGISTTRQGSFDEETKTAHELTTHTQDSLPGRSRKKSFLLFDSNKDAVAAAPTAADLVKISAVPSLPATAAHRRRKSSFSLPEWMDFLLSPSRSRSLSRSFSNDLSLASHSSHSTVVIVHDRERLYSFLDAVRERELRSRDSLRELLQRHCTGRDAAREDVTRFHSHDHHDHDFSLSSSQKAAQDQQEREDEEELEKQREPQGKARMARARKCRKSFDAIVCEALLEQSDECVFATTQEEFPIGEYLDTLQEMHERKELSKDEKMVFCEEKHRAVAVKLLADALLWLAMSLQALFSVAKERVNVSVEEDKPRDVDAVEQSTIARLYEASLDQCTIISGTRHIDIAKTLGCYSCLLAQQGRRVERDASLSRVRDILRAYQESSVVSVAKDCAALIQSFHQLLHVQEPVQLIAE